MNDHFKSQKFSSESEQDWQFAPQEDSPESIEEEEYLVNTFGLWHRIRNTILGVGLLAYGAYGVWVDDLYIPGRRSRGVHLHGMPAWIMYGALICGAAVLLSVVVDHYDQRNNETHYECFRSVVTTLGFILGLGVLLWNLFEH